MKKKALCRSCSLMRATTKYLTIASWILSAVSALIALLPFYYIWRIMQEVVLVAPDYSKAQNLYVLGGVRWICTVIYVHLYLRTAVLPHCGIPCAGQHAQHI